MQTLRRTPLYDRHVALGARMVPFAGWEMPVQYASIIDEHRTVRTALGLFDLSHMGELLVSGPDALAYLRYCVISDPGSLALGQAQYSMLCGRDGGVIDDLTFPTTSPTSSHRRCGPRRMHRRCR